MSSASRKRLKDYEEYAKFAIEAKQSIIEKICNKIANIIGDEYFVSKTDVIVSGKEVNELIDLIKKYREEK